MYVDQEKHFLLLLYGSSKNYIENNNGSHSLNLEDRKIISLKLTVEFITVEKSR